MPFFSVHCAAVWHTPSFPSSPVHASLLNLTISNTLNNFPSLSAPGSALALLSLLAACTAEGCDCSTGVAATAAASSTTSFILYLPLSSARSGLSQPRSHRATDPLLLLHR